MNPQLPKLHETPLHEGRPTPQPPTAPLSITMSQCEQTRHSERERQAVLGSPVAAPSTASALAVLVSFWQYLFGSSRVGIVMGEESVGIGLDVAIEQIRADLLKARSAGEGADIRMPVQSVTVQLQVVASKEREAKAGFKVPFVQLEAGGSGSVSSQQTSTVTVVFGEPVDRQGVPVKVSQGSDRPKG
jgi:hypothetical protein